MRISLSTLLTGRGNCAGSCYTSHERGMREWQFRLNSNHVDIGVCYDGMGERME